MKNEINRALQDGPNKVLSLVEKRQLIDSGPIWDALDERFHRLKNVIEEGRDVNLQYSGRSAYFAVHHISIVRLSAAHRVKTNLGKLDFRYSVPCYDLIRQSKRFPIEALTGQRISWFEKSPSHWSSYTTV